jgi:hypothetical protein
VKRTRAEQRCFWFNYRLRVDCPNAATYWIWYALSEPRDFAYSVPGRIACRLFGHHGAVCRGIPGHSRG